MSSFNNMTEAQVERLLEENGGKELRQEWEQHLINEKWLEGEVERLKGKLNQSMLSLGSTKWRRKKIEEELYMEHKDMLSL